ncbi:NlpC/P60 family protein [Paraflavisolibacter sp. H34]|uniref:C40 family peptidase n=1 Tax=Huijunlia imazamoxiresistens TaxID=3127457 RepID=UPI0030162D24
MVKKLVVSFALVLGFAGFPSAWAQKGKQKKERISQAEVKFLDDITVDLGAGPAADKSVAVAPPPAAVFAAPVAAAGNFLIENASHLQLKYAILLNTEVEQLHNLRLFSAIDEWYGVRYQYGGSSKDGIDCSAFVQTLYSASYGTLLPRTASEQYGYTQRIEPTELKEGDLVFFNTSGGVSHVGLFLTNTKFVHASTTGGVMVSDLNEAYWSKRFIGCGRVVPAGDTAIAR